MAKKKKRGQIILIIVLFFIYFIAAARPVPREIIVTPKWINSLETEEPLIFKTQNSSGLNDHFPFTLGYHFGYIDTQGKFIINRIKNSDIYLSDNSWTEYSPEPSSISINNITGDEIINIENPRGYPVLLDNRVFILGSEQNSLSEIDRNGNTIWTYEFGSILTDMDVASDLVAAVSIDGVLEILDKTGQRIYFFQPGGSRLEAIYGCAVSGDGTRIGLIAGYDPQRFLLLERFSAEDGEYRVVYHEFLEKGIRRPVRILFADEDSRVVFERQGGVNCYNIKSRKSYFVPLEGEVAAIEDSGDNGMLFLITRHIHKPIQKELIGIKLPKDNRIANTQNLVFLKAPFKSEGAYLYRKQAKSGSVLITGGGNTLISFDLEER